MCCKAVNCWYCLHVYDTQVYTLMSIVFKQGHAFACFALMVVAVLVAAVKPAYRVLTRVSELPSCSGHCIPCHQRICRPCALQLIWCVQAAIVAIIAATLFLRTHLHPNSVAEGQLYSGFLFFTLLQMFFSGIAEMTFAVSFL